MRIASYNIRKAVGLDRRRKPGRILDVINALGADVVVLQEADRRLGRRPAALPHRLIETHSDFQIAPVAANDVSLGWHGNAILVRRGLTIHAVARLELPGLEPRGGVLARIGQAGGDLTVIGTHLALGRLWRVQQMHRIIASIPALQMARSIIAGDFNEWSAQGGLEPLRPTHRVVAPGLSFHARRPIAALDRVSYGNALALHDAGVDQSDLARKSSDHLPVWADLAPVADEGT